MFSKLVFQEIDLKIPKSASEERRHVSMAWAPFKFFNC